MFVFDWICMDFVYIFFDGFKVLCFECVVFIVFDFFLLKWLGVEIEYIDEEKMKVRIWFEQMDEKEKQFFVCNMIVGFFGLEESFILE